MERADGAEAGESAQAVQAAANDAAVNNTRHAALLAAASPEAGNHANAAPTPTRSVLAPAQLGFRQLGALLQRQWRLKARGWRQTLAEFATPTLLMAALVVGAQLAEITTSTDEIFANKLPFPNLVTDARYKALDDYFVNHTRGACGTVQLFVAAAAPPGLVSSLGWDIPSASAAAAADAPATVATLAAFNLTLADLLAAQSSLAPAAGDGGFGGGIASQAAAMLGVQSPALDAALSDFLRNPLNTSQWSVVADAAVAGLLNRPPSNSTADDATNSTGGRFSVSGILGYNGPIPIPALDEFIGAHVIVRGLFSRYEPAWAAYRAVKDQLGFNPLGNLVELGGVAFVPATPEVVALAAALARRHVMWAAHYKGAHADVATARDAAADGDEVVGPWAVVVFDEVSAARLSYTIRMRYTVVPGTDDLTSRFYKGLGSSYLKYITSGFLSLQRALDEAALDGALGDVNGTAASVGAARMVWETPFPVFSFLRNSFYESSGPLLGLVMCLSLLYPLGMLLKGLVEEKETGTRELMRISGLQSWALGAAWALTYVVLFVAVATAAAIVLGGSVFPHCDVIVIWGLLFVFMLSIIPLGFVISTFFNRARLASIFGPFALFGLVLPRYIFFRTTQGQALAGKRAACLLSPTAFTFAADSFGRFEAGNAGVTLDNLWEGELSVGECMAWLLLDTFLYSLLAFYLDKATITATLTAWARAALARWRGQAAMPPRSLFDVEAGAAATDVEAAHAGAPVVLMRGLTKVYDNGVRAVSGLDLTLYDGEITCLLGHNGAGKSTAISLLTGLVAPTAGAITVCGLDVRSDMRDVRGLLGVCPQQNVLFPLLTVAEHLRLFAVLKAVPGDQVTRAVGELMHEVGLEDKAHAAAAALSGGMKRRLQLACALVGGSRVIVLDEPTSGMDPVSRRNTWDLLRRIRAKRCVLLTTHYLDEADLLADRVAIMSEGRLRAAGSPLFLKQRLGGGYTLTVTSASGSAGAAADSALSKLVAVHAPDAVLLRAAGGELSWQFAPALRGCFGSLLTALEQDFAECGLSITMATLEEVFLRLAGEAAATVDAAQFTSGAASDSSGRHATGASLEMTQLDGAEPRRRRIRTDLDGVSCLPGFKARGAALLPDRSDSAAAHDAHDAPAVSVHDMDDAPAVSASDDAAAVSAPPPLIRISEETEERTFWRAFVEMMRKRALIARRDYKSVLSQVALPVLAVSLVLLVLKLDIDPTGPALQLSASKLAAMDPKSGFTPVWYPAGAAHPGAPTDSWARGFAQPHVRLVPVADARNSTVLSRALLANRSGTTPFRYGAYVPDDVVLPRFSPSMCLAGVPSQQGAAAGLALLAAATSSGAALPTGATVGTSALAGVSALRSAQQLAEPPVNILHNTSASHALPIFLHELRAAQLRALGGPELSVASHPLPLTAEEVTTLATFLKLLASFFVLIPFSYLPATYAAFVVRERAAGAKLLQLASGCGSVAYWTSAFAWEMLNHTAVTLLCLILFGAFQIDVLVGSWDKGLGAFLLLWLYGFAVIPLSFCYSFLFDSNASAQVAIACANFVTGFCLVNASFIMSITPSTVALNARLVQLFRIFPAFCLGEGLIALATSSFDFSSVSDASSEAASGNTTYTTADGAAPSNSFGDFSTSATKTAFRWEVLGRPLILLCAECALYFAATLLIELCGKRAAATVSAALEVPMQRAHALAARFRPVATTLATKRELAPDPEVTAERERMQASTREGASADDVVQVRGLRKVYPARGAAPVKVAVHDLWLSLKAGDRFGLLGANGAGKTTTLSILCCDVAPSAGDALVGGSSVVHAPRQVQRHIGFCPQYDPLLDLLTVREHLHLYARLKGMPERHVAASAEATWRRVGLGPFADRLAGLLSGGNKRKLSLAIAIIGAPAVLLCDEPSSGMDPQARRNLWDTITACTQGMAVVLTTHAMDEAEALCARIGIMADGALCCLGSAHALKQRYGDGHVIDAKAQPGQADALHAHMAAGLPGAVCTERHAGKLRFTVPRAVGLPLSLLFAVLEAAPAEDWAVSQSSLEAVFVSVSAPSEQKDDA